jgi:protein-tyrosine-phosphatase
VAPRFRGVTGSSDLDVPDPYRRSSATYREAFALIEGAVDGLVRAIGTGCAGCDGAGTCAGPHIA